MKKKETVIELQQVTKSYILHHQKPTLSEQILNGWKSEKFIALDNISLKISKGEKVGIIGKNGSGKTTLLKIISGITTPNNGQVITKGKIVSLIDLEAGFHPDLTGEENIFLNGLVIGMSKKEIQQKFKTIIKTAGIGKFIDTPLYTYSQGMKLRLGFAIAISSDPDILILDEGFMVGDEGFKRKVSQKINQLFIQGKTVVIVSHWLEFVRAHCNRIIEMEKSKVKNDGGKEILRHYAKA